MSVTPPTDARPRLDFLDVARGTAAMLVMCGHGLFVCLPSLNQSAKAYGTGGAAAVLLFFMVSGFVIPMSLEHGRSLSQFWLRRLCRLFPVYWLSIALAFGLAWVCGRGPDAPLADVKTWIANVFMVQNVFGRPHLWGAFWTLPYEMVIYFTCSLLFAAGLLHRIGGRVIAVMIIAFAAAGTLRPFVHGKPLSLEGIRVEVALSCLCGLAAHRYAAGRIGRRAFYGLMLGLAATLALVWGVNLAFYPAVTKVSDAVRFACVWALGGGFFVLLLESRGRVLPRAACWLGRHCYPIYLLHPFVLAVLSLWTLSPLAYMTCLIAVTLAMSAAARVAVELPGIAFSRRLERHFASRAVAAPAPLRRAA